MLATRILDISFLLPFAVFGVLFTTAWLLVEWMTGGKPRAEERLEEMRDPARRRRREAGNRGTADAVSRMLEKATPTLAKPLQPKSEKEVGMLKQRLAHAGFRSENAATVFLGLKFFCLLLGVVVSGGGLLIFGAS